MFRYVVFFFIGIVINMDAMDNPDAMKSNVLTSKELRKKYMLSSKSNVVPITKESKDLTSKTNVIPVAKESKGSSSRKEYMRASSADVTSTNHKQIYHKMISSDPEVSSKKVNFNAEITSSASSSQMSSRSSPHRSPRKTSMSSEKDSKNIRKCFESSSDYKEIIGQGLVIAATEGNLSKIKDLLCPNLNCTDENGRTPLAIIAQQGNVEICRELLAQENIDVNKADRWSNTPLHQAALHQQYSIVKLLLYDFRVNSSRKNDGGYFAHQLMVEPLDKSIKGFGLFFYRFRLDSVVDEEIPMLRLECANEKSDSINQSITLIKEKIEKDHKKQTKDRTIPEMENSPINDEFIRNMIVYRLAAFKQGIKEFQKIEIINEKDNV